MLAPQTPFLRAWGQLKRGFEVLAPSANTSTPFSGHGGMLKRGFQVLPTPETPFSTAPMPEKHISHSANTSNPLFNRPHALKHTFHPLPTPQTPFSTAPMPSNTHFTQCQPQCQHLKPPFQPPPWGHISHSANTSNPLFNCPHALKHTCANTSNPLFNRPHGGTHISPTANTSNPLFNCPHALKNTFHPLPNLKPHFQLGACPQNTFQVLALGEMCFSPSANRGFEVLALGEMCFEGMGAVEKGV